MPSLPANAREAEATGISIPPQAMGTNETKGFGNLCLLWGAQCTTQVRQTQCLSCERNHAPKLALSFGQSHVALHIPLERTPEERANYKQDRPTVSVTLQADNQKVADKNTLDNVPLGQDDRLSLC